jgi:hypothetical protein
MTIRITPAGRRYVRQRALEEGFVTPAGKPNESALARLAFAYMQAHMPRGWRP